MKYNGISRLIALCAALVLLLAMTYAPAQAAEAPYEGEPSFVLLIREEEADPEDYDEDDYVQALLVEDPETGLRYLVAASAVLDALEKGDSLTLYGDDGLEAEATILEEKGPLVILNCDELVDAENAYILGDTFTDEVILGMRSLDEDGIDPMDTEEGILDDWDEDAEGRFVFSDADEMPFCAIGAPVLTQEEEALIGILVPDAQNLVAIAPLTDFVFPEAPQEEEEEEQKESAESFLTPGALACIGGGVALGWFLRKKKEEQDRKEKEQIPQQTPIQGMTGLVQPMQPLAQNVTASVGGTQAAAAPAGSTQAAAAPIGCTQPIEKREDAIGVTQPSMPPREKAVYRIKALNGVHMGSSFPIERQLVLGRRPQCNVTFPSDTPGVSGNHCKLVHFGERVQLVDLGSTYGTFCRDQRLQPNMPLELKVGEVFSLGEYGQLFRLERIQDQVTSAGSFGVISTSGAEYRCNEVNRMTFGRSTENLVAISTDNRISGKHCVLYRENGQLFLKDLGSTNGTFLNGQRIQPETPFRVVKGNSFYLGQPSYGFTIVEG